jgi:UDP-hydrolysing UDP-N-acetyl-D-glucosamine 2-epimerase
MPHRLKHIAVVCTARPSWAKLLPVCDALRPHFKVDLIAAAYAVTHTRSGVLDMMVEDGWPPTTILPGALDGNTNETSAVSTGLMTLQFTRHFASTKPDLVIVCADRHETLAAAISASYMNTTLLHLQGGEVSSSIDQKVRYANTALSDYHCVSNQDAYARVVLAGAYVDRVYITGCPSIDVCRQAREEPPVTADELAEHGTGLTVNPLQPFTILMMHPTTTHPETAEAEWHKAWTVAQSKRFPIVAFWPGADAGMDAMAKAMRVQGVETQAKVLRTLPPRRFLKLLSQAAYGVGNSSALIREASFFGLPRSILGDRQRGRPFTHGASTLYGDGFAAEKILDVCRKATR